VRAAWTRGEPARSRWWRRIVGVRRRPRCKQRRYAGALGRRRGRPGGTRSEVLGPPGTHAVALGVRPAQHQAPSASPAGPRRADSGGRSWLDHRGLGTPAALNRMTQSRSVQRSIPRLMCHLRAAHAVERIGQHHQPAPHPAVALLAGQPAQLVGRRARPQRWRSIKAAE
jgi:hypothetical protein